MLPVARLPVSPSSSDASSASSACSSSSDVKSLTLASFGRRRERRSLLSHWFARFARSLLELIPRAADLEQLLHRLGGLRTLGQPLHGLVVVDVDPRGLGAGLVGAEDLDEPAV